MLFLANILFIILNMCAMEFTEHMFKLMGKEINAILGTQTILIWNFGSLRPCENEKGIQIIHLLK